MTSIHDLKLLQIPKIADFKGNLSVVEQDTIPFEIKRVFYLFDIRSDQNRIGHAHKELQQVLIALSGSFEVVLKDGKREKVICLNKPNQGLLIVSGIWRELQNFSSGAVCLVLASAVFDEQDYIRNYSDFKSFKNTFT